MAAETETIQAIQAATEGPYKWGFETEIEMEFAPKGLNEDIVRFISKKKNEPEWLLEWRLKAFALWRLTDAAEATFGTAEWPAHLPVPQAWLEFELASPEAVEYCANADGKTYHFPRLILP